MNTFAKVFMEANLTKDPEISKTTGKNVCTLDVAVNEKFKPKNAEKATEKVHYFRIEIWGTKGEACYKHLEKGQRVRIWGKLIQDRWTDNDQNNRSLVKVRADEVEFGPSPKKED